MPTAPTRPDVAAPTSPPRLQMRGSEVIASGTWRVEPLADKAAAATIRTTLGSAGKHAHWNLSAISELDYIGAQLFWDAWGKTFPADVEIRPEQKPLFDRLASAGEFETPPQKKEADSVTRTLQKLKSVFSEHLLGLVSITGQFILDILQFLRAPQAGPWKEISANIYNAGSRAVGITALVGFLIGVVLSYLSAQQLHNFGGDIYLVDLLGIGITRELGPLLAAILVAGRSGSSMTAQIGVMRVTEELDAMQVMGLPQGFRLVMPKVIALIIVMPLLVMWTNIIAMLGGMIAAQYSIGLTISYFLTALPKAIPIANLTIGLGKGAVFGALIALISCHFGLRIQPNTESLGQGTTSAVVTAITIVILTDAIFAIVLQHVGWS